MSLRLISITRRYGAQLALDGVTAHVRRGDCYGFIGHNGAGKTTAMRVALGLSRATSGTVLVDGFDAVANPREARARMGGLIEVPGFHGALDGATNLMLLARLGGLSRGEARAEAGRLLEVVGLPAVGSKPVQAYSHGMRQRLGIAQALIGRPSIVLLDEPTNGLDPQGIAEIRGILRRLVHDEGLTVMLSSHQLHEIADVCNRIGLMKAGKLIVEAETSELLADAEGRYLIATDRDEELDGVLDGLGLHHVDAAAAGAGHGAGRLVELGTRAPGEVSRAVVERGLALERFGPRPPTLEEIYLRASSHEGSAPVGAGAEATAAVAVPERIAPGGAIRRAMRYEFGRWSRRPWFGVVLLLPALFATAAIALRWRTAQAALEQVDAGDLFSVTQVTAFQAVGSGLSIGLPLAAWILAGLASQSIAGELARGTLRNVLLRPLARWQLVIGKALALLAMGALSYAALAAAALGAAGLAFDFADLAEVLPNGDAFPLPGATAAELRPLLVRALMAPLVPLAAMIGVGFLAGSVLRNGAGALAAAFGSLLFFDLARGVARGVAAEGWFASAYLPSPLGDSSFFKFYGDLAEGVSNTAFEFAESSTFVPPLWCLATFGLAALVLSRRSVP